MSRTISNDAGTTGCWYKVLRELEEHTENVAQTAVGQHGTTDEGSHLVQFTHVETRIVVHLRFCSVHIVR